MRLSPHCQLLLQEFRDKRQELLQLDNHVFELISQTLKQQGIELNSIEHRIKTVESLAGKLERKGGALSPSIQMMLTRLLLS